MQDICLVLQARDPARNIFRSYVIEAGRDLFGEWVIDIYYGRIGSQGQHRQYSVANENAARQLIAEKLKRRRSAKGRIGVSYRICSFE